MFGLLKKNDFDAEIISIKSQLDKLSSLMFEQQIELQNQLLNTYENIKKNQIQNNLSSLDLNNISKKFDYNQIIKEIMSNFKIDFLKGKNSINTGKNSNRFLEEEMNRKISFELQKLGIFIANEQEYPVSLKNQKSISDISIFDYSDNKEKLQCIIELKRWDSLIDEETGTAKASINNDKIEHLKTFNKLCVSKNCIENKNIKHLFITCYEDFTSLKKDYQSGYIAAKKKSNDKRFGPFNIADINMSEKTFEAIFNIKVNDNNYLNDIINSFNKSFDSLYNSAENEIFDFNFLDLNNIFQNGNTINQKNPFLLRKCKVVKNEVIENINLSTNEFLTANLSYLLTLPSNWKIRVIEVL